MRWSKVVLGVQLGLSGTSLALAVGCNSAENASPAAESAKKDSAASYQSKEDRAADADRYAGSRNERRSEPTPAADTPRSEREVASRDTPASSDDQWFLRPVGQATPSDGSMAPQREQPPISNPQPVKTVATAQTQPPQPKIKPTPVQQVQPRPKNWGWQRAACGRG
ncbi:MAG: hypothetical protein U0271_12920 [Polyangiaceae bacterium]